MSHAKQCPSTTGKRDAAPARGPREISSASGRAYWRSLEDLAESERFREFLDREFPAYASELTDGSRRHFLKVMGASLALAGAATIPGCRRPDHKILPYTKQPEHMIEGRPLFYASAMPLPGGGAEGVLVETFSARPTKIEGNPLHPYTRGASSIHAQASILDLYDPQRLSSPTRPAPSADEPRPETTWAEFDQFARAHFGRFDGASDRAGRGLFFLVEKTSSPSRDRMRDRVLERWPRATWLPYEPIDNENERAGLETAFGSPMRSVPRLENAKTILSLDANFLTGEYASIPSQRGFGAGRRLSSPHGSGSEMNRLYAVESAMTATGMAADHRLRLRPSMIPHYAAAIAQAVLAKLGGGSGSAAPLLSALSQRRRAAALDQVPAEWLEAVAQDLVDRGRDAVVLAGPAQPPIVHAFAAAMNDALGSIGRAIEYRPLEGDLAASSERSIRNLRRAMRDGQVRTLVVIGANPLYDAPANEREQLREAWADVDTTIVLATGDDETGAASDWQLPRSHWLESWGDARAFDGTLSVIQPMIAPLYASRSDLELLALLAGDNEPDGYEIVRETWRGGPLSGAADFEKRWRRALHDGLLAGSESRAPSPSLRASTIANNAGALPEVGPSGRLEAVFAPCAKMRDGRHANNGWLQELPDPVTKMTWDNPVLMSPATAKRLGLSGWLDRIGEQKGPVVNLTVDGRSMELPVWRVPGMADDTLVVLTGYGRERSGLVGEGTGFDTWALRSTRTMRTALAGVELEPTRKTYPLACTQDHQSMEDRPIVREFDLPAYHAHGGEVIEEKDPYGRTRRLTMAERVGTESHTPANVTAYEPSQQHDYSKGQQWGMSIDLSSCIGCGVCTIACQSENNIPVVGKIETNKGREMHWIRVDRYFSGDPEGDVAASVQPVACVHCENAPCETVCPVNATIHSDSGLNVMAYNRCIGTRYCSNNCPYKVRRFNFFDYGTKRLNGDYYGKDAIGGLVANEQMIPPRLREKNPEVVHMSRNPHVTVRERGVMEKCTYCVQRINDASVRSKLDGLEEIPDGYFEAACQQACPTGAIVFGDINQPGSAVSVDKKSGLTYGLLGYLNTVPRTSYRANVRNPNPALREPVVDPFHHGGHGEDHGADAHGDEHARRRDPGHLMSLNVLPSVHATTGGLA